MTVYEILTGGIALISLVIAVTSLIQTRKLGKVTEELNRKQIAQIESKEKEKELPKLHVDFVKLGNTNSFIIANRGQGSAYNLNLELVDCSDSPLIQSQLDNIFPHPELRSESRIKLLAAAHFGSPITYIVRLTWKDSNGKSHTEDHHVNR